MDILHSLALRFKMLVLLALHATLYLLKNNSLFFAIMDSSKKNLVHAIALILGEDFTNILTCFQS